MSDLNINPILKKFKFNFDIKLCIICQKKDGKLTSSENGMKKIKEVAAVREDFVSGHLKNVGENDDFYYHMTNECYRSYCKNTKPKNKIETNDGEIDEIPGSIALETQTADQNDNCSMLTRKKSQVTQSSDLIRDVLCIFCNKKSYKKSYDKSKITDKNRAEIFFKMTRKVKDAVFIRTAIYNDSSDVTLHDVYYHKECYKNYERIYEDKIKSEECSKDNSISSNFADDSDNFSFSSSLAIEEEMFSLMKDLETGLVVELSQIRDNINKRNDSELSNIDIKRYLEKYYEKEIRFAVPSEANMSTVIFHSSLKIEDLVLLLRPAKILKMAAEIIKNSISKMDYDLNDRFCDANDLKVSLDKNPIPSLCFKFFADVLDFKKSKNTISSKNMLKMESLFQHMVFISKKSKLRTPLQVMLSLKVHDLCKSKNLITNLNHMGLAISYDEVRRIKDGLAFYNASKYKDSMPLPSHFDPKVFTIAAFDNFDHNLSNFSGLESTHDTVSVVFQRDITNEVKLKPKVSETKFDKRVRNAKMNMSCQQLKKFSLENKTVELPEDFPININKVTSEDAYNVINVEDLAWLLCRMDLDDEDDMCTNEIQSIPGWSAFNSILLNDNRPKHKVGFLPVLPHPVTKYDTVYTSLCNFLSLLDHLDQEVLVVFCDEGVYHLAEHIKLACGDKFKNLIIMLGGFHMLKAALACFFKYLRDTGIENLLIHSRVFGPNVVDQVMQAGNYARSIKCCLLIGEVMERIQLEEFLKQNRENFEDEINTAACLKEAFIENNFGECKKLLNDFRNSAGNFKDNLINYNNIRKSESSLYRYWNNVLSLMRVIRDFLRADRSGDFKLHIQCVEKLLPIFHVMDRTNYARWCTLYLNDLLGLEKNHIQVYNEFLSGNAVIKATDIPFSSVSPDQRLEQTINFSKKSNYAIIGQTNKLEYVLKWDLNYHELLFIDHFFDDFTLVNSEHYEFETRREFSMHNTDEYEQILQNFKSRYNPFDSNNQPLHNMYTNVIVGPEDAEKLLSLFKIAIDLFYRFCLERLYTKSKSISATITRINLPTFKPKSEQLKKKVISKQQDAKYSQRIIDLAREREFCLETLFTYELTMHNYLFDDDDLLRKDKNKSQLRHELEKILKPEDYELPDLRNVCVIIDVMTITRRLKWNSFKNFKEFADEFCSQVQKSVLFHVARIDFIFDAYFPNSIKSDERSRRYTCDPIDICLINDETELPKPEESFWASAQNKVYLQSYLRQFIIANNYTYWPTPEIIFSATEDELSQSTDKSRHQISLKTLQRHDIEEADSRIILHTAHIVDEKFESLIIQSCDTDVLVLLLNYFENFHSKGMKQCWLQVNANTRKSMQYVNIPVHKLAELHGYELCNCFLALYNLSGADYTSKIGTKHSALLANPLQYLIGFAEDLSEDTIRNYMYQAEKYLVRVLDRNTNCKTFDSLRYKMYTQKMCAISELPCSSRSVELHILRAFFATYNLKNILSPTALVLDLNFFGYNVEKDKSMQISPRKNNDIYPPIRDLVPCCTCLKCATKKCICRSYDLPCISFCRCHPKKEDCKNPLNE